MSEESTPTNDEIKAPTRRRRSVPWLLGGLVLLLLAIIVAQQPFNLWALVPPDTASDTLFLYALSSLNFAAFVVFSFILLRSLVRLRRERRERQLGSRLKTRLVVYFIGLSLLPITAMAAFSYLFINRSIEKWMSRLPENVVERVREQQRSTLASQNRNLQESATLLAMLIKEKPETEWQGTLDRLSSSGQLSAIEIVSDHCEVIAKSEAAIPTAQQTELKTLLDAAQKSGGAVGEKLADGKGFDLIAVPLDGNRNLLIVPGRLGDEDVNDTISESQREYQHLLQRQRKVRMLGLSTLGLMTLLLLFASTWIAIYVGRGIARPIASLAEASKEVARGNLSYRVGTFAEDELALLAESFNQMTAELESNRHRIEFGAAELQEKNLALEERRAYIETVLESLSTGVISIDQSDRITTINAVACSMLKLREPPTAETVLSDLLTREDRVVLERLIRRTRRIGRATEQAQLMRGASESAAIPVAVTATALRSPAGEVRGVVLVMEDLSELLDAQRAAAWSEVARRMAHEIKNPLTPIQLSADRIARSFHLRSNGDPASGNGDGRKGGRDVTDENRAELTRVVEECTTSISREVAGLKAMVDEFSRFARLPHPRMEVADLNEVLRQTALLYEGRLNGAELRLELANELPETWFDAEQVKRVFVNLIDNALEALSNVPGERRVTISTKAEADREVVIAEVADTGEGIENANFKQLFQPNFSTRGRGTGLGLAIVERIVVEHGGHIHAEGNQPRGAKFVIEFPVTLSGQ
jgi:two-component system, NtrC family, nitrogen regulation sensor histidine kinase NtrY